MMTGFDTNPHDRSVSDLEREVDREREDLGATIDALREKASIGSVLDQVVTAVGENGGDISRNLGRTIRDNPLPVILTGVGLAWLMAGSGRAPERRGRYDWDDEDDRDLYGAYGAAAGPLGGPEIPRRDYLETDRDYVGPGVGAFGDDSYDSGDDGPGMRERAADAASDLGDRMGDAVSGARDRTASAASGIRSRASGAASGVREFASDVAGGAQDRLHGAGDRMRDAGDAAREGAYRARRRALHASRDAREGLEHLLEDQPLVLGALALALGAAVGGVLPNSRREDRMFGQRADRVRQGLRDIAEDEGRKAGATVGAMATEAQAVVEETADDLQSRMPGGREMVEAAGDRLDKAARRVADAGSEEAERQHLGETDAEPKSKDGTV